MSEEPRKPSKAAMSAQLNSLLRADGIALAGGQLSHKDLPMHIWESVSPCDPDRCPARLGDKPKCNFPERFPVIGKCHVQASYIKTMYIALVNSKITQQDEYQIAQIGFLLLPLYGHLVKFKIYELGLDMIDMFNRSKAGHSTHPVYKEIRDTIKCIASLSQDLLGKGFKVPSPGDGPSVVDMMNGDPTWYAGIEKAIQKSVAEQRKPAKRVRKVVEDNREPIEVGEYKIKQRVPDVNASIQAALDGEDSQPLYPVEGKDAYVANK